MTWLPWTLFGVALIAAPIFFERARELLQSNRMWREFYFEESDRWRAERRRLRESIEELQDRHGGPYR